jgi:hypothetical protein
MWKYFFHQHSTLPFSPISQRAAIRNIQTVLKTQENIFSNFSKAILRRFLIYQPGTAKTFRILWFFFFLRYLYCIYTKRFGIFHFLFNKKQKKTEKSRHTEHNVLFFFRTAETKAQRVGPEDGPGRGPPFPLLAATALVPLLPPPLPWPSPRS